MSIVEPRTPLAAPDLTGDIVTPKSAQPRPRGFLVPAVSTPAEPRDQALRNAAALVIEQGAAPELAATLDQPGPSPTAGRPDPLESALRSAFDQGEPELPECFRCGNQTGPWVPTGDRWPSGAQKFVCASGDCQSDAGEEPATDGAVEAVVDALHLVTVDALRTMEAEQGTDAVQDFVRRRRVELGDWRVWLDGMQQLLPAGLDVTALEAEHEHATASMSAAFTDWFFGRVNPLTAASPQAAPRVPMVVFGCMARRPQYDADGQLRAGHIETDTLERLICTSAYGHGDDHLDAVGGTWPNLAAPTIPLAAAE